MSAAKPLARAFESFLILLATFLLHRFLTYPLVFGSIEPGTLEATKAIFVGCLSDVWVAFLWAAVIGLAYGTLAFLGMQNGARLAMLGLLALVGVATAMHVAYIEFFHFQIVPFHLRYLVDPEFVAANGSSLFTARSLTTLGGFFFFGLLILWLDLFQSAKSISLVIGTVTLGVASLAAHNRNIHLRIQWFVPENLQVNGFERLYLHAKASRLPKTLTLEELKELANLVSVPAETVTDTETPTLFRVLTLPVPHPAGYDDAGTAIRRKFQEAEAARERPLVVVVLLESMRPADTGYFSPSTPSLTPNLDALAHAGVSFVKAYGTGSVTRGAQEATLCGYRGARDTSVMRGLVVARITCLGDLLKGKAETFWLHGGDGRFDGQRDFWRLHGIDHLLTGGDFPAAAARTGWGVGDQTFLAEAAARLLKLGHESRAPFLFGQVLTVSNHIPWDLPADARPELSQAAFAHPSHRTTAYADGALGHFVGELKRGDLWQKTLLVIVSDHGNNLPPVNDLYAGDPRRDELLSAHVNLVLSGGIAEAAAPGRRIERPVIQADVAPFLAYVMGLQDTRFFADGLFANERRLPLYSDLEQGVFVPTDDQPKAEAPLYSRALFQYMSVWSE